MKLQTSIPPRRDGTVIYTGKDGTRYVFTVGADGAPECEVEDPKEVAVLLATQNFYPADPGDYGLALALAEDEPPQDPETGAPVVDPSLKSDDELDEPDDEGDPNALPIEGVAAAMPIEAATPPQVAPDRAAKANAAVQASNKNARKAK